jgi:hypothetical protein
MDQIGQKQKANEQNRVKPRPKNDERPGNSSPFARFWQSLA